MVMRQPYVVHGHYDQHGQQIPGTCHCHICTDHGPIDDTSDSRLRLEALVSSLTTITSVKPDRDMTDVLPIIDVIFNEAHADRHGATKANELLSIVEVLHTHHHTTPLVVQ